MNIAEQVLAGSRRALSKAITAVENEYDTAVDIMKALYPHTGRAHVIGITGAPGAGKSTLTDKLAKAYRRQGKKVGIIAIDPTSPFSRKTAEAVKILDAFGMDVVFVETVGVGQSEVDIVKAADTTIVVMVPGLGDDIQAIKAGILEIGDVFAINKADREGVDKLHVELDMMLDLNQEHTDWRPPVKRTVASRDEGVTELVETIGEHFEYLQTSGALTVRRRERTKNELLDLLDEEIGRKVMRHLQESGNFDNLVIQVEQREKDPYSVVREILHQVLR